MKKHHPWKARIKSREFKETFGVLFHTDEVPIIAPVPQIVSLRNEDGNTYSRVECFMLDLRQLSAPQYHSLVDILARKFQAERAEVAVQLKEIGLPIEARHLDPPGMDLRLFI